MSRRNSRILAFQALYSWEVSQSSLEDLLAFSWLQKESDESGNEVSESSDSTKEVSVEGLDVEEKTFAEMLITGTLEHVSEIDEIIKNHLSEKWSFDRVNKVTLAILRTAVYEIKYLAGSAKSIVIDEAVTIAKRYGADDAYKFINAILDKISKEN
ncbi:MAG: transcription antitermination factor NusB [Treponema sp.]|nr:transcription antitermination factor NusB [Treponema sp.]